MNQYVKSPYPPLLKGEHETYGREKNNGGTISLPSGRIIKVKSDADEKNKCN